jgi:hypothetical protein
MSVELLHSPNGRMPDSERHPAVLHSLPAARPMGTAKDVDQVARNIARPGNFTKRGPYPPPFLYVPPPAALRDHLHASSLPATLGVWAQKAQALKRKHKGSRSRDLLWAVLLAAPKSARWNRPCANTARVKHLSGSTRSVSCRSARRRISARPGRTAQGASPRHRHTLTVPVPRRRRIAAYPPYPAGAHGVPCDGQRPGNIQST